MSRTGRFRRRSASYAVVLGMATIIALIGVTALTAARIELRTTQASESIAAARFGAESAMDMAVFQISQDANWLDSFPSGAWRPSAAIGRGTYTWKLAYDSRIIFSESWSMPVTLYGRAFIGDAARTYSADFIVSQGDFENLLDNSDFESGTSEWFVPQDRALLEAYVDDVHSGAACLRVTNRADVGAGPAQYITDRIERNGLYYGEAWIKLTEADNVLLKLKLQTTFGPIEFQRARAVVASRWTKLGGSFTPNWFGTLVYARFKIETATSTQNLLVDGALLIEGGGLPKPTLEPVAGTWRPVANDS